MKHEAAITGGLLWVDCGSPRIVPVAIDLLRIGANDQGQKWYLSDALPANRGARLAAWFVADSLACHAFIPPQTAGTH